MNPLYILDVFAEEKYVGNQLAVVTNAAGLSDEQMQKIAREMHFSETTFVLSNETRNGGYDVRIFTPDTELPFAGHPTLGTAYLIQREIIRKPVESIVLNLKIGPIRVNFEDDTMWMHQNPPTFGRTLTGSLIAEILQIDPEDIDERFPIQQVSTGLNFWIVPLKTLAAVKRARPNWEKYLHMTQEPHSRAAMVFSPETYDRASHLNARVFAGEYGVYEDPATGSANGCLAGYLVKHGYFGQEAINVRVEQGMEIKRPALLLLKAEAIGDTIEVLVGGRVILVAKGELV